MITRIVKLQIAPENKDKFIELFSNSKTTIKSQDGCYGVKLLQLCGDQQNIFFTYSHWESEAHLNQYRESAFFEKTWKATKALFNGKPEAWSVNELQAI